MKNIFTLIVLLLLHVGAHAQINQAVMTGTQSQTIRGTKTILGTLTTGSGGTIAMTGTGTPLTLTGTDIALKLVGATGAPLRFGNATSLQSGWGVGYISINGLWSVGSGLFERDSATQNQAILALENYWNNAGAYTNEFWMAYSGTGAAGTNAQNRVFNFAIVPETGVGQAALLVPLTIDASNTDSNAGYVLDLINHQNAKPAAIRFRQYATGRTDAYIDFQSTSGGYYRLGTDATAANKDDFSLTLGGGVIPLQVTGSTKFISIGHTGYHSAATALDVNGTVTATFLAGTGAATTGLQFPSASTMQFLNQGTIEWKSGAGIFQWFRDGSEMRFDINQGSNYDYAAFVTDKAGIAFGAIGSYADFLICTATNSTFKAAVTTPQLVLSGTGTIVRSGTTYYPHDTGGTLSFTTTP